MRTYWICLFLLLSKLVQAQLSEQQFNQPDAIHASGVHWHWVNGNVNREGVNLDLEAMAATGLRGGNLYFDMGSAPAGSVRFNSPEWKELLVHTLQQADRLGLKFNLPAASGSSSIECPWITPDHAQQIVVWSATNIVGGDMVNVHLPKPLHNQSYFKDIAVLAYLNDKPIDVTKVLDLSPLLDVDGKLNGNLPKGNWTVVRIGSTVAQKEKTKERDGFDMDKLSKNAVQHYFDAFLKPLFEETQPYHGRSLLGIVSDGSDLGVQNWTPDLKSEFKKRAGYDLTPFLLVLTGRQVNSVRDTERFLWDLRRVQSDMMDENYVGLLQNLLQKSNLVLQTEHASTTFSDTRCKSPSNLKVSMDSLLTNQIRPNVNLEFELLPYSTLDTIQTNGRMGFDRNNALFKKSAELLTYLRRCQYMLQEGLPVADAACFTGEEGLRPSPSLSGHVLDELSRNDLLYRSTIKNNRLILPDGRTYRLLILPEVKTLSLPILEKLQAMLEDGLWISATKPTSWAGMLPMKEQRTWKSIVEDLWNKLPDGVYRYGAGRLFINIPTERIFDELKLRTDFSYVSSNPTSSIRSSHRRVGTDDYWFVCNNRQQNDSLLASFRITGKQPEWWNPQTGEIHSINIFRQHDEQTLIPLLLHPNESGFVVFRSEVKRPYFDGLTKDGNLLFSADPNYFPDNMPTDITSMTIDSADAYAALPYMLEMHGDRFFRNKGIYTLVRPGASKKMQNSLVLKNDLTIVDLRSHWSVLVSQGISGTDVGVSTFQRQFNLAPKELLGNHLVLDLGEVSDIAEVFVNGKSAGTCWMAPYLLEVTSLLKLGENQLEIQVTKTSDEQCSPHIKSGLIGPVTLSVWKALKE